MNFKQDNANVTVIYHANCADGFCCAWLLHKIFPDARYRPIQHGDLPDIEDIEGRDVIIADFSFGRLVMIELMSRAKTFVCLDHHKTAEESLRDLPGCHFDMNKCGAQMVWDHFGFNLVDSTPFQWLVDYVADRDLWKWNQPNSKHVNAAIQLRPFDFQEWDELARLSIGHLTEEGKIINTFLDQRCKSAVANAKLVYLTIDDGIKLQVPCVNVTTGGLISFVGEALAKESEVGIGMTYFFDGSHFVFSLRSISGNGSHDVSEIAKLYCGGGHKNAAGFRHPTFFPLVDDE